MKRNVPVSTDPGGATVYLDGKLVCTSTPCSVEATTDQAHLVTIVKDGFRQRDITLKLGRTSSGEKVFVPDVVTLRLSRPGELDVRDPDSVVDTAVGMGVEMLKRVLEDQGKGGN
jgi:hypothetical protein